MWSVITCRCYSVHSCRRQCSATGLMCRRGTAKTDRTVTSHRSLSRELLFHSLSLQQQQQQQQLHPSTSGPSICHDCWSIRRSAVYNRSDSAAGTDHGMTTAPTTTDRPIAAAQWDNAENLLSICRRPALHIYSAGLWTTYHERAVLNSWRSFSLSMR